MSRLFIFGDSFSNPLTNPEQTKDFLTFYHSVAKKLDAKCYNFSKQGSGPEFSMDEFHKAMFDYKFDANDYIIMLLSDPGRDYDYKSEVRGKYREHYGFENIRNLIYLNYLSNHFYHDVKIFCNIIWNFNTFCEGKVLSEGKSVRFIDETYNFPNSKFRSEDFQKLNDVENFYYCDCELGIIHMQEFNKFYNIRINVNVLQLSKETTSDNTFPLQNVEDELTIEDFRINHMSQRTHDTFAKLILDFFLHNKKPVNTNDMFEKGFLVADDPYVKIKKEFVYE